MQVKKHKRRKYAAPVGGLFIVLVLVGIVTVVVSSIRMTASFLDNTGEKEMFEDIIRPVLMFDPVPFEQPEDIEMLQLLQYSMWAALTSDKRSSYSYGDGSQLIVPASDLDVACARLFGADIQLVHQPFGEYENRYYYDENDEVYNVPISAQLYVYSPSVEEIEKEDDLFRLLVGYIPPVNAWTTDYSGNKNSPVPDKYMYYYMRQSGDTYHLVKVRDLPQNQPTNAGVAENQ